MSTDKPDETRRTGHDVDSSGDAPGQAPAENRPEPTSNYDVEIGKKRPAAGKNDTARLLDEISRKNTGAGSARRKQSREPRGGGGILAVLLFLYVLGATGFLAYQQYLTEQNLNAIRDRNMALDREITALGGTLGELRSQVEEEGAPLALPDIEMPAADNSAVEGVQQSQASLLDEIEALRRTVGELESQQVTSTVTPDFSWRVFEAEYLTNFAAEKLSLEADLSAAIALLQRADQALADSGKTGVFNAREALAADIARLRGVEQVDRAGIYLRLDNLSGTLLSLDMLGAMRQRFSEQRDARSEPLFSDEQASGPLNATLEFLNEVFVWREWQEPPEAILAPGEDMVIRQNLQLAIKQTQLGLLNRDTLRYQQGLQEARALMEQYTLDESPTGKSVLDEIDDLLTIDIEPQLPTLEQSVTAVRQIAATER